MKSVRIDPSKVCIAIAIALIFFFACKKNDFPPVIKPDIVFYALSGGNQLQKFNAKNLSMPETTVAITGLQSGETILAIDFRPATGQLYGLGSSSRIYVLNYSSGVARAIGTMPFSPALSGPVAGFDFNPTVDRIRVVTSSGQNLRINPETGAVAATDAAINGPAGASINAVAYSNNFAGAAMTTLFDIDMTTKKLYKQDPPNNGTLVEVGALGIEVSGEGGFDISPNGKIALGVFSIKGKSSLALIDLTTGKATNLGDLGKSNNINGLAIPTDPVAFATDEMNNLLIFNPLSPSPVSKPITGLQPGENILGIDFRPVNGQLYALGSSSRIYTVNNSSGAATVVGSQFTTLLNGMDFGFDFNPTVDRIRVVSNSGQNIRLNPETGAIAAVDASLNPGTPVVTAAAYTNNFAGATSTTLFDIDTNSDKLFKQDPPNNGTLVEVGPIGINAESLNGFDIGGTSGTAFAILKSGAGSKIYNLNLTNGSATALGDFPKTVKGLAIGLGF